MSLDHMSFPSTIDMTKEERQANAERVAQAAARIHETSPPERCPVCGQRSCASHTFDEKMAAMAYGGPPREENADGN